MTNPVQVRPDCPGRVLHGPRRGGRRAVGRRAQRPGRGHLRAAPVRQDVARAPSRAAPAPPPGARSWRRSTSGSRRPRRSSPGAWPARSRTSSAWPARRRRSRGRSRGCGSPRRSPIDPNDGSLSFSFAAGHAPQDVDDTIEHLLRMLAETSVRRTPQGRPDHGRVPGDRRDRPRPDEAAALRLPGAARGRAHLPGQQAPPDGEDLQRRQRAVLAQRQARRAPADQPAEFRPFIQARYRDNGRDVEDAIVDRVPRRHRRPPLRDAGALLLPVGRDAGAAHSARSAVRHGAGSSCAPSTPTSATCGSRDGQPAPAARRARRRAGPPLSEDYRARHGLRGASTTQKAVDGLVKQEIVAKDGGFVRIAEPFYAEWIRGRGLLSLEA